MEKQVVRARNNQVPKGSKGEFGYYSKEVAEKLQSKGLITVIPESAPIPEPEEFAKLKAGKGKEETKDSAVESK